MIAHAVSTKHGRELALDVIVGLVWAVYAGLYLARVRATGRPVDLLLFAFVTLLAGLFVVRRPSRTRPAAWEMALALAGTFLPAVLPRPAGGGMPLLGQAIQVVSLVGVTAAAVSLGRSFGLAPADRGLCTDGAYRCVRHPLYGCEFGFYVGYLVANPSERNVAALVAIGAIQVARIVREERVLADYDAYAARVRWRLVPFLW